MVIIPARNGSRGFCHAITEFDINPNTMEKSPMVGSNFAPPQGIILMRPPNNERSLDSTSLSASA